jgi:hypothetical protein
MPGIYFGNKEYDATLADESFESLRPTTGQSIGNFSDSIRESFGIGTVLKDAELGSVRQEGSARPGRLQSLTELEIDNKTLNERYGIPGYLDFNDRNTKYTERQAEVLYRQKLRDIDRGLSYEQSTGAVKALRFGADFVYQMADPIGLAVGVAAQPVRLLAGVVPSLGKLVGTVNNALAPVGKRAGAAFVTTGVDASIGTAALLPYAMTVAEEYHADISFGDALKTIVYGGLAGGILHAGAIGAGHLAKVRPVNDIESAPLPKNTSPETHSQAFESALTQAVNGKPIDVSPVLLKDASVQAYNFPAHQSPEFKSWFGASTAIDAAGKPKIYYHGTAAEFDQFTPKQAESIYVTDNPDFAQGFAVMSEGWMKQNGQQGSQQILPLYVKAEKTFNPDSSEDITKIFSAVETILNKDRAKGARAKQERVMSQLSEMRDMADDQFSNWDIVELPEVQQAIKELGYDSYYVTEAGQRNLAVYKPEQLKSAIGNSGRFDSQSKSLTDQEVVDYPAPEMYTNKMSEISDVEIKSDTITAINEQIDELESILGIEKDTSAPDTNPDAVALKQAVQCYTRNN